MLLYVYYCCREPMKKIKLQSSLFFSNVAPVLAFIFSFTWAHTRTYVIGGTIFFKFCFFRKLRITFIFLEKSCLLIEVIVFIK